MATCEEIQIFFPARKETRCIKRQCVHAAYFCIYTRASYGRYGAKPRRFRCPNFVGSNAVRFVGRSILLYFALLALRIASFELTKTTRIVRYLVGKSTDFRIWTS